MTRPDPNTPNWRTFFDEYFATPVGYGILAAAVMSTVGLVMTWAGWRGGLKPWGDPIPFCEALATVPEMAAWAFVVTFLVLLVTRARF